VVSSALFQTRGGEEVEEGGGGKGLFRRLAISIKITKFYRFQLE
jgi:hypothetical protein